MVERVPGRLGGKPVVKHSRVTADAVVESYELGETAEEIAYSFTLRLNDVKAVLEFAASRASMQRSA